MTEIISVRFKDGGKDYYFDPSGHTVKVNDKIIVETEKEREMATVSQANHKVDDSEIVKPLRKMIRFANNRDFEKVEQNKKRAAEAMKICEEKVQKFGLDMKLVSADISFDGGRYSFCFIAEGRVDFRMLVKDLAATFHARIDLRQIGVRDEAQMLGGLGICGQPYCCSRFLNKFHPVSIKMAKDQGLSLNPAKVSGSCGRLMCCLDYEQDTYRYLASIFPKVGATVQTASGSATVTDVNLISGNLMVKPIDSECLPFKIHISEVLDSDDFKKKPHNKGYR